MKAASKHDFWLFCQTLMAAFSRILHGPKAFTRHVLIAQTECYQLAPMKAGGRLNKYA
jgi:hypothetical protein